MAVVTRQRWWRLSQGSDGGGCHTDDVMDVVSHWTSADDSSLWLLAGPSQGHLVTSTQCLAVWCSLSAVASVVVGAKRTEKSYFKNKLDTGHSRGLLDMGGDTKMAQR